MFYHNFKYSLKILLRNKGLIFWTFIFPIILGTFFKMAFSNIEKNETLKTIDIAIVDSKTYEEDQIFKETLNTLSNNDTKLFNITVTTKEISKKLLEEEKITGYLEFNPDNVDITVSSSGVYETILRYVIDEIYCEKEMLDTLTKQTIEKELANGNQAINPEEIAKQILTTINNSDIKLNDISNKNLSYTMIEFYTLIAMTCLYGGMLSMVSINQTLANMSNKGKRIAVSPTKKGTIILSSLLASYIAQLIGLAILFVYTLFVLKVDYGDNTSLIILLAMIGSFAGLTLGTFVGTLFKTNENAKTGILIALTMFWCYLSGMMGITMKYVVDKNVPIINKINPASMITDGLYSLYYYDTFDRYWFNIISLLIFAFVLMLISFFSLRRQKYDSI